MNRYDELMAVFTGSNGEVTKALYDLFMTYGVEGPIVVNLFRAQKTSSRAKQYRGRYRGAGYDTKDWAIGNICTILRKHGATLGIIWGWKEDPAMSKQDPYRWVIYIDTPCGQVSFHRAGRGDGPSYPGAWDESSKQRGAAIICQWMVQIERAWTEKSAAQAAPSHSSGQIAQQAP